MQNSRTKHGTGRIDIGVLLNDVMVEVGTQIPSGKDGEESYAVLVQLVPYGAHLLHWLPCFSTHQNHQDGLKHRLLGPISRVSD